MNGDWFACDGRGHAEVERPLTDATLTRRGLIAGLGLGAVSFLGASPALAQVTLGNQRDSDHVLVSIFLRGGADGLSMVVPKGEDAYHRNRPELGVRDSLDLDGFFGLHTSLAPLLPLFKAGNLAVVHACGSMDQTRSHFEAMNAMERGLDGVSAGESSGWLARHLVANPRERSTPLRAVALSRTMPDSLRGATHAIALESLAEYRPDVGQGDAGEIRSALADLYSDGSDPLTRAGRETLSVLESLGRLEPGKYQPANGAVYPDSDLGRALSQVAFLTRADVGLEVACLDKGGWDTHYGQNLGGQLAGLLDDLAKSVAAFERDLGREMSRVTIAIQTEFGRRVRENRSLGTDHGRGSVMFVLGGGIKGGKVYGKWPGLENAQLDEVGDLKVTTDYRSVLAELMERRMGGTGIQSVFPGLGAQRLGLA